MKKLFAILFMFLFVGIGLGANNDFLNLNDDNILADTSISSNTTDNLTQVNNNKDEETNSIRGNKKKLRDKLSKSKPKIPAKILNVITRVKSKIILLNMIDNNLIKIIELSDKVFYNSNKFNLLLSQLRNIKQGYEQILLELRPNRTNIDKEGADYLSGTEVEESSYSNIDNDYIIELWNKNNEDMKIFIVNLKLELINLQEYFIESKKTNKNK